MYYLNVPLKQVPAPPPENRWLHRLQLFGVWLGYTLTISTGLFFALRYMTAGALPAYKERELFLFMTALIGLISLVFMGLHNGEAKAKRWRAVAYPAYRERTDEVKAWAWDVIAAAVFDEQWRIVCVRRGADGAKVHSLSVAEKLVTPVAGESDALAFADITYVASSSPGGADKILIGGDVTLIYDRKRGGPPPLKTELSRD